MRCLILRAVLAVLVLWTLAGCQPPAVRPSAPPSPSPTIALPTTPPATPPTFVDEIVLDAPTSIGPGWSLLFALAYGDAPEQLGTSPGGEGVMWGPAYGTQLPDGTWWFLDAAHLRLARYSETGQYLSDLVLPPEFLTDEQYFQWATPFALADGTLVLTSTSLTGASLLLVSPAGSLNRVPMATWVGPHFSDGTSLFGFTPEQELVRINPRTGRLTPVRSFTGQSGDTFELTVTDNSLQVVRGATTRNVPVLAADAPQASTHPWVQAGMGADGVLSVLVVGTVEETIGDARTVAGFVTIDHRARVSAVEPVPTPFSDSDPGGGPHVGVRYGDSRPWLMFVDTDALRVYRRG